MKRRTSALLLSTSDMSASVSLLACGRCQPVIAKPGSGCDPEGSFPLRAWLIPSGPAPDHGGTSAPASASTYINVDQLPPWTRLARYLRPMGGRQAHHTD